MAENPRIIDLPGTNTLNNDDSLIVDNSTNNCRRIEMGNLLKQIQSSIDVKTEYLSINGNNQMQSDLKMNNKKIVGLANGINPTDAITMQQVNGQIEGLRTNLTGEITGVKGTVTTLQTQVNNISTNDITAVKANVEQLRGQLNQLVALAKAGTKNGLFKFTPSKGVVDKAVLHTSGLNYPGHYDYYSGPVLDNVKNHYKNIPIDTNNWFYIERALTEEDKALQFDDLWVGYLTDPNNLNSIEWWYIMLQYGMDGKPTEWSKWSKSNTPPWYSDQNQRWEPA